MILRVIDLAIEDRLAHRETLGASNPCRRLGSKCSRLPRCRDFLSPSHRLPVKHILITTADTNLIMATFRTTLRPRKLMGAGLVEYRTKQAGHKLQTKHILSGWSGLALDRKGNPW